MIDAAGEIDALFDVLALAAVARAVETWDARVSRHREPDAAAPLSEIAQHLHGAAEANIPHRHSARAQLVASLRRLRRAELVLISRRSRQRNLYAATAAGGHLLTAARPRLPEPRCHVCDEPGGRTDLNEAATADSGLAAGSPEFPVCAKCLLTAAERSLAFHSAALERVRDRVAQLELKVTLARLAAATTLATAP